MDFWCTRALKSVAKFIDKREMNTTVYNLGINSEGNDRGMRIGCCAAACVQGGRCTRGSMRARIRTKGGHQRIKAPTRTTLSYASHVTMKARHCNACW